MNAADVPGEGALDYHANDGAQVSMSDAQSVQLSAKPCNLTQGRREQVLPQLSLDPDSAGVGVLVVEGLESRYVTLICWGRWAEGLWDGGAGRLFVFFCGEGVLAEPPEDGDPAVCVL